MPKFSRQWLILLIGTLTLVLAYQGSGSLWAAPSGSGLNQTVPFPTATPENTPVPTATPVAEAGEETDEEPEDRNPGDPIATLTPVPTETPLGGLVPEDEAFGDEEQGGEGLDDGDLNPEEPGEENGGETGAESPSDRNASENPPTEQEAAEDAPKAPKQTAEVKPIVLNVRSGPGTDSPVIGTVFQGDQVAVLGRKWRLVACLLSLRHG